jgi:predicted PurR-regulated permease PerM
MQKQSIDISTSVIIKTVLVFLGLWFLYLVRDVIALLVVSVIFVSAIEPVVDWLGKKKIPRSASVLAIYAIIISVISLAVSFLIPPISEQIKDLSANYPVYSQKVISFFSEINNFITRNHISIDTNQIAGNFGSEISNFTRNIFSTTLGLFSGIISIIVVFSLTFYMSVEEDGIKKFIASVSPVRNHEYLMQLTDRIKRKIGKWLIGQFFLMFIIFILDWIGLSLAGVPYALILAIFAGIMEIIPYVGPIISAVPGVVLGFLVSPTVGLLALVVYVISQQLENHIITPQIMKKAVGLSPITVILVLLIGAKLAGITGAILAIPVGTALSLIVKDYMENRNGK